jgi:HlyD family secretion protein
MTTPRISLVAVAMLAAMLAGCNENRDPGFQGWVEAA